MKKEGYDIRNEEFVKNAYRFDKWEIYEIFKGLALIRKKLLKKDNKWSKKSVELINSILKQIDKDVPASKDVKLKILGET